MKTVSRQRHREEHREVVVPVEVAERLVGAVGGRRQAVGAEADPGEEGDEREVVKELGVAEVTRLAEQTLAERWHARLSYLRREGPEETASGLGPRASGLGPGIGAGAGTGTGTGAGTGTRGGGGPSLRPEA